MDETPIPKPDTESGLSPSNSSASVTQSAQNSNSYPYPNFDGTDLSYYTEEQLKDMILKRFGVLYGTAISAMVESGFNQDLALKAILKNGHIYGEKEVFCNIYYNALDYLAFGCVDDNRKNSEESKLVFDDLRQLGEYSLDALVGILQKVKPHLSKGNAMWSLLMSNFEFGRAISMEIPVLRSPRNVESFGNNPVANGVNSDFPVNKFSDVTIRTEIENPKRFSLSPEKKTFLRTNVSLFAAGFKSKLENLEARFHDEEFRNSGNQGGVNSVLGKFRDLNLDDNVNLGEDHKDDEVVSRLIDEIKDLEKQVKEKKEWAQEKAIQAAKKLSGDLIEFRILRMGEEETKRLNKRKHRLTDKMMKTSGEVEKANEAVKKLEADKAEIKAEMEAIKLNASEADSNCLQAKKRENKYRKRISGYEKQKARLQEDCAGEKQKILELKQELARIQEAQKVAEAKCWQEQKAKELAQAQIVEEQRLKEETVINNKRKQESLRQKIEIDIQFYYHELQRLEQERSSQLKVSAQSTNVLHEFENLPTKNPLVAKTLEASFAYLLVELIKMKRNSGEEIIGDRECLICEEKEATVVFLPCAHQVVCASCNEDYGKNKRAMCPCCRVPIEQSIHVFGSSL